MHVVGVAAECALYRKLGTEPLGSPTHHYPQRVPNPVSVVRRFWLEAFDPRRPLALQADQRQQWVTGLNGTHIQGADQLCLDVQDASTKDGANVMSYACGDRPGGNQRWSVEPPSSPADGNAAAAAGVQIVTKLNGACLTPARTRATHMRERALLGLCGPSDDDGHRMPPGDAVVAVLPM